MEGMTLRIAWIALLALPPALLSLAASPSPSDTAEAALSHLQGRAALERGDHAAALEALRRAVELDPGQAQARLALAEAALALGFELEAREVILQGLALRPDSALLHEALGDLEERADRLDAALAAWRRAQALAPSPSLQAKIARGEREARAGRDHLQAAGSHFQVLHDGDVDAMLASEVLAELEARHAELSLRLSHAPERPVTVILYAARQFHAVTGADAWVGGLYDGKIRVPLGGLRSLGADARRLLAHELTHALVHSKTRGNCPRWLHEGLAQIVEGRPLLRADQAEIAQQLGAARTTESGVLPFSYPVALALTLDLQERWGFDGLVHLLDRLGAGEQLDDAFRRVTGETSGEFIRRWAGSFAGGPPA